MKKFSAIVKVFLISILLSLNSFADDFLKSESYTPGGEYRLFGSGRGSVSNIRGGFNESWQFGITAGNIAVNNLTYTGTEEIVTDKKLPTLIDLSTGRSTAGDLIFENQKHKLKIEINQKSNSGYGDAYLWFSSYEAMYDFGLSFIYNAIEGDNEVECYYYPDGNGGIHPVNGGIRLSKDSARLFIFIDEQLQNQS